MLILNFCVSEYEEEIRDLKSKLQFANDAKEKVLDVTAVVTKGKVNTYYNSLFNHNFTISTNRFKLSV